MNSYLSEKLKHIINSFLHIDISDPDTQISFWSGHLLTTSFLIGTMGTFLLYSVERIIAAFLVGIIGGLGGVLGSDVYKWIKPLIMPFIEKIKSKFIKTNKNANKPTDSK